MKVSNTCLTLICKHLQCFEVDLSHICGILGLERVSTSTLALKKLLLYASGYTAHQPLMAKGYSLPEIHFLVLKRFNTLVDFFKKLLFLHILKISIVQFDCLVLPQQTNFPPLASNSLHPLCCFSFKHHHDPVLFKLLMIC